MRLTDEQIMTLIVDTIQRDKLLKGLIYLHDITQPRFGRLAENHIYLFEKLCGVQAFENIMLVTTKWAKPPNMDPEENDRQHARAVELKEKFWKEMTDGGSTVTSHDGTAGSARRIVTWLLNNPTIMRLARHRTHPTTPSRPRATSLPSEPRESSTQEGLGTVGGPGILQMWWRVFSALNLIKGLTIVHILGAFFGLD